MRLASFNVENFFARAKALNRHLGRGPAGPGGARGAQRAARAARYTDADKTRIVALLDRSG